MELVITKKEYNYLYNLNPELHKYLQNYYEIYDGKEDYLCVLNINREGIEKILYYLPEEHYLRKVFQGYVEFKIKIGEW